VTQLVHPLLERHEGLPEALDPRPPTACGRRSGGAPDAPSAAGGARRSSAPAGRDRVRRSRARCSLDARGVVEAGQRGRERVELCGLGGGTCRSSFGEAVRRPRSRAEQPQLRVGGLQPPNEGRRTRRPDSRSTRLGRPRNRSPVTLLGRRTSRRAAADSGSCTASVALRSAAAEPAFRRRYSAPLVTGSGRGARVRRLPGPQYPHGELHRTSHLIKRRTSGSSRSVRKRGRGPFVVEPGPVSDREQVAILHQRLDDLLMAPEPLGGRSRPSSAGRVDRGQPSGRGRPQPRQRGAAAGRDDRRPRTARSQGASNRGNTFFSFAVATEAINARSCT